MCVPRWPSQDLSFGYYAIPFNINTERWVVDALSLLVSHSLASGALEPTLRENFGVVRDQARTPRPRTDTAQAELMRVSVQFRLLFVESEYLSMCVSSTLLSCAPQCPDGYKLVTSGGSNTGAAKRQLALEEMAGATDAQVGRRHAKSAVRRRPLLSCCRGGRGGCAAGGGGGSGDRRHRRRLLPAEGAPPLLQPRLLRLRTFLPART